MERLIFVSFGRSGWYGSVVDGIERCCFSSPIKTMLRWRRKSCGLNSVGILFALAFAADSAFALIFCSFGFFTAATGLGFSGVDAFASALSAAASQDPDPSVSGDLAFWGAATVSVGLAAAAGAFASGFLEPGTSSTT